jgi:hypothetical protein
MSKKIKVEKQKDEPTQEKPTPTKSFTILGEPYVDENGEVKFKEIRIES